MKINDIKANTDSILGWAMMAKPEFHPHHSDKVAFQLDVRGDQLERQVSELTKLIYKIVEDMQDENRSEPVTEEWVNKDLRDQLVKAEQKIKNLHEYNSESFQEGRDLAGQVSKLKESVDYLKKDLSAARQYNEMLREQLADAQADGDAFDQVEASHLLLALENKELLEENSTLTDKINHYQSLAQGLDINFRNVQKNYLELNDEKVAGDEHIRDIETELNKAWNDIETLRSMLADAQVDRDAFDNLEFAYNQLVPENKSLRDTYNKLGKKYADLQTANGKLVRENEALVRKVEYSESMRDFKQGTIDIQKKTIKTQKGHIDFLKENMTWK